jgi:phosphate/phosphite/phosphonate ABC transporter binding protein
MSSAESPVTFAIISSAPAASALLETVCDELVKKTSKPIKPVVLRSYDKLVSRMRDGEVQVAWAPPLVAIELERETKAQIRLCSRRAGRVEYMSALFVAAGSDIRALQDLKGKRAAWVAKESSAGYVVPRLKIAAAGLDPDELFSEETFRRTHEAVIRGVLKGEADVGATYASYEPGNDVPVSSGWLEAGIDNAEVRVIATAGPIPSDVIAMASSLPEETATAIADALKDLGAPMRSLLNADAFETPQAGHFDALRELVKSAKDHAPPSGARTPA